MIHYLEELEVIFSALQKISFFGHLWSLIGSIKIEIKYLESAAGILTICLQTDMSQIIQIRYYKTFNENLKQNYRLSKFAVKNHLDRLVTFS